MKKILFVFTLFCFGMLTAQAQKVAYVNTEYILSKVPEYAAAQQEVEQQSKQWQEELERMYREIEEMYKEYQAAEVMLPEKEKIKKQEEIMEMERKAKEYKKKKFGYEGDLYELQDEKIKPIQDKVYEAIEKVATRRRLDFIFDKAGNASMIYTNSVFDVSDQVLEEMGITP